MKVTYTPSFKAGRHVVHARVVAEGEHHRMTAQVCPDGVKFSFFSDYTDGLCMLTKDNKKIYDQLKQACLAELEKH
jgi:hypothetical protein